MRAKSWITGRTSILLVFGLVLLLSCSPDSSSGTVNNTTQTRAEALVATNNLALDVLRAAVVYTVEELGHDRFQLEQRFIQSGPVPRTKDLLAEHGLVTSEVVRQLATNLGYRLRSRDEAVSCAENPEPRNHHPCRLSFEGAFYSPRLTRLSEERATASVGFMASPSYEGVLALGLVRTGDGWTVVNMTTFNN